MSLDRETHLHLLSYYEWMETLSLNIWALLKSSDPWVLHLGDGWYLRDILTLSRSHMYVGPHFPNPIHGFSSGVTSVKRIKMFS